MLCATHQCLSCCVVECVSVDALVVCIYVFRNLYLWLSRGLLTVHFDDETPINQIIGQSKTTTLTFHFPCQKLKSALDATTILFCNKSTLFMCNISLANLKASKWLRWLIKTENEKSSLKL